MDTYDPMKVTLVIGGNIISGFHDGSFIQVSRDEDTWLRTVGADGRVARARNANKMGMVTFTLQQGSPSNSVCSSLHNADELTGVPPGAFQLIDQNGTTVLAGDETFFLKPADVEFAKEVSGRQWSLAVPKLEGVVGGVL